MKKNINIETCILCHSKELKLEQELEVSDIISLYEKDFNFNFSSEFNNETKVQFVKCKNCSLQFFETKFSGSPNFYEVLQEKRGTYYVSDRDEFYFTKAFIKKEHDVLEIGSGSGYFAEKLECNSYLGLEFNEKAITEASKKGVVLINSTVEDFQKNTDFLFDIVCSFHVLEHVKNPFTYIESSLKLLKKEGLLIVSVPLNDSPLTSNVNHTLNMPPHHVTRWSFKTFYELAKHFNLDVVSHKNHSISKLKHKDYFKISFLKKVMMFLFPKNKVTLNINRYLKTKKIVEVLVNKLKLEKLDNRKQIGENVTFVFRKK